MQRVQFEIPGAPKSLLRARRAANGGMYDPKQNKDAKREIGMLARPHFPKPATGPVSVFAIFTFPRPASHRTKSGLSKNAPEYHVRTPDVDNLAKLVLDALTGIAWIDDCQIVRLHVEKLWESNFTKPGTFVEVMTGE